MTEETKIKLFQNQKVRLNWDDEIGEYYFSVIDVVGIIKGSKNPSQYWRTLKSGSERLDNIVTLFNCIWTAYHIYQLFLFHFHKKFKSYVKHIKL